jgi:hypothetical protein
MRRIAREANGFTPVGIPLSMIPDTIAAIKTMTREAGRDPDALELVLRANVGLSANPLGADRPDYHGTLEQIGEDVAKTREVCATEMFFDLWTSHPQVDSVADWLKWMERLWEATQALTKV